MTYIHINEPGVKDTLRHGQGAAHYQDKPVSDPGFPRQVAATLRRGQKPIISQDLCRKLYGNESSCIGGGRGGCRRS